MDIDLLKTFLEVNKTRHFGKAADSLYLTPAAVSARVRQLEQTLGVDLFIRTRNNIRLTLEGERLVPHAEAMLLSWSRALQDVSLKSVQEQQINIGANYSLWSFGLNRQFSRLFQMLPQVAIRAISHPSDILTRMLLDHTLDLVFFLEAPNLPDFHCEKVGQVKLVLLSSSASDKLSAKSALQSGYVYVDWGISFELFHAKRFGDLPNPILRTNMGAIALDCLQNSAASAFLPHSVLHMDHPRPLYRVPGVASYSRPLYGVFRASSERMESIGKALDLLKPIDL